MAEHREIWSCPQCGTQLDVGTLGFCAEVVCPQCGNRACLHTLLANFKLDGVLGIGGMSEVFRAHDMVLGRTLAIKVLNSTYRNEPERIARFESECSLMAKVRHENVVSVYSAGWARGQFYIAMEMVEGRNLETIISEQKCLLPPAALEMTRQAALGLRAAHEVGILHRDVKPGNVLVTPEGVAKVLDFGLSQGADEEQEKEGVIWATPFYVPPETLMRKQEDVRADIYALGMMLRNLLTGEDTLKDEVTGITSLLAAKRRLPRMRDTYPKLQESLADLVDHMTAFEAEDRPADYAEVLEEIEEVRARVGSTSLRETDRARRRRNRLMSYGVLGTAVAGLLLALPVAYISPPVNRQTYIDVAPLVWQDAEDWQIAEKETAAGHWVQATDLFAALAEKSAHPGVAAAAAMHAAMLSALTEYTPKNSMPISELLSQKCLADAAGPTPMVSPGMPGATPSLRAAELVLKAQQEIEAEKPDAAESVLGEAAVLAETAGFPHLKNLIDDYRRHVPRMTALAMRNHLRLAMKRGDFSAARAVMARLQSARITEKEKAELGVQAEVCDAGEALYELLQRKRGDRFDPSASVEEIDIQIRALAQGNTFDAEAHALLLMIRGEYAGAFAVELEKDNSPFGIVLNDWKARLKR